MLTFDEFKAEVLALHPDADCVRGHEEYRAELAYHYGTGENTVSYTVAGPRAGEWRCTGSWWLPTLRAALTMSAEIREAQARLAGLRAGVLRDMIRELDGRGGAAAHDGRRIVSGREAAAAGAED